MSWRSLRKAVLVLTLGTGVGAANGCAHPHANPPPPAAVPPTKPDHELAAETGIPVASSPQGLMQDGAIKKIQERLRAKDHLEPRQCNGELDTATRTALRKFQKSEGLPTTGLPSYETVDHLGLDLDTIFHTTSHPTETVEPGPTKPASAP